MAISKTKHPPVPLDGVDFGVLSRKPAAAPAEPDPIPEAVEAEDMYVGAVAEVIEEASDTNEPETEPVSPTAQKSTKKTPRTASSKDGKAKDRLPSIKKRRVVLMLPEDVAGAIEIKAKRQRSLNSTGTHTNNSSTVVTELVIKHLSNCIDQYYEELELANKYL